MNPSHKCLNRNPSLAIAPSTLTISGGHSGAAPRSAAHPAAVWLSYLGHPHPLAHWSSFLCRDVLRQSPLCPHQLLLLISLILTHTSDSSSALRPSWPSAEETQGRGWWAANAAAGYFLVLLPRQLLRAKKTPFPRSSMSESSSSLLIASVATHRPSAGLEFGHVECYGHWPWCSLLDWVSVSDTDSRVNWRCPIKN